MLAGMMLGLERRRGGGREGFGLDGDIEYLTAVW